MKTHMVWCHCLGAGGEIFHRWIDSQWHEIVRAQERCADVNASMKACGADPFRAVVISGQEVSDVEIVKK